MVVILLYQIVSFNCPNYQALPIHLYIYKKLDTAYAETYGITYNLEATENIEFPNWSTNNIISETSDRFGSYVNVTNTIPTVTDTKFLKHTVINE